MFVALQATHTHTHTHTHNATCNAHALYCHLWPIRLHNMFLHVHCLIKGMIFDRKFIEHKTCVLIFSTTFV